MFDPNFYGQTSVPSIGTVTMGGFMPIWAGTFTSKVCYDQFIIPLLIDRGDNLQHNGAIDAQIGLFTRIDRYSAESVVSDVSSLHADI